MVDASGQDDEVALHQTDAHPFIIDTPHVKKAFTVKDVSNFFILMQVFLEERLHLVLVGRAHFLQRDDYFITIFVGAFGGNAIDSLNGRAVTVEDPQLGQVFWVYGSTRIVVLTLIALRPKGVSYHEDEQ